YDELIDHPVELGTFDYVEFTACGVPHGIAVTGRHRADLPRLARDLQRVCEAQIRFFGEPAPFGRYLFQIMAVGQGYGGLEHRSSTSLLCSRDELPRAGESESKPSNGYRSLLGLCSHEYFHSWNVKRLKPAEFVPYDLRRENHTTLLWFFEGVTSYYDDLFLVRTGLISPASYLELLAQQITRHLRTPGRDVQTVSESSFFAWTKYYKTDENTPNSVVSYYVKGALVALCLDFRLRERGSSLDMLMQRLWRDYGRDGRGLTEADIRQAVQALAGGDGLDDFLDQALHATEELPWQALLEANGIDVQRRAAEGNIDAGGRPGVLSGERPWLGVRTQAAEGGVQLGFVQRGGPAEAGGLSAGDLVVALDGLRVTAANWEKRLLQHAVGDSISVYAFRRDEWLACSCLLAAAPLDTCVLTLSADPSARTLADRWLLHT
ncbi:MAG: PDZ domain-containing protein, partial [Perlucidibaca sp.]